MIDEQDGAHGGKYSIWSSRVNAVTRDLDALERLNCLGRGSSEPQMIQIRSLRIRDDNAFYPSRKRDARIHARRTASRKVAGDGGDDAQQRKRTG